MTQKQWYKVEYVEIARDGIEQEEGCDFYEAETPADAVDQCKRESERAGAKTHSHKAAPATESEIRMHFR